MELHPLLAAAITNGDSLPLYPSPPLRFKFRHFLLLKTPDLRFSPYSPYSSKTAAISFVAAAASRDPRWDSNAEDIGSQKFKFRRNMEDGKRKWWSDEPSEDEEDDNEDESWILDEVLDSIWILKVFKSFGWTLPPIIISWLLASGPKAFLMALALPLGQSLLTFVFGKLSGKSNKKPRRKTRRTRQPFVRTQSDFRTDGKEEEVVEEQWAYIKEKEAYQSWVVDDTINSDTMDGTPFGGWDELDAPTLKQQQRKHKRAAQSQRMPLRNSKLSSRGQESSVPLLLRLLLAVFPFLSSWTKML